MEQATSGETGAGDDRYLAQLPLDCFYRGRSPGPAVGLGGPQRTPHFNRTVLVTLDI